MEDMETAQERSRKALMDAMGDQGPRLRAAWDQADGGGFENLCRFLAHETVGWPQALIDLEHLDSKPERILIVWGERCFRPEEMEDPASSEQVCAVEAIINWSRSAGVGFTLLVTGGMDLRVEGFHEQTAKTMYGKLCEVMGDAAPRDVEVVIDPAIHTGDQARAIAHLLLRYAEQRKAFDAVITVEPRGHIARFDATWAWCFDELNQGRFERPVLIPAAYGNWDAETRFGLTQAQEAFAPKTPNVDAGAAAHHSAVGVVRDRASGLPEGTVPGGMCDEYGPSRLLREAYEMPGYGTDRAYASYAHTPDVMLDDWLRA